MLPIFVANEFYGFIGFDDCKNRRNWANEDILLLKTAADMIGTYLERKQSEIDLRHAMEKTKTANKAKSEFLANMSHEIRTPLNSILGFTELLDETVTDLTQRSYLDSIKASSKTLLTLINDILDLSKIEAGKMSVDNEPMNIHTLFHELNQIFNLGITRKGLQFIFDVSPDLPAIIFLSEIRLRQVLVNLIGNAVKFTHEGHIRLQAGVTPVDPNHIRLVITVEDTGIGIEPDQQELIFEAFQQQNRQDVKKFGGTGLGLTISKRLTEMMGGKITLHSRVNEGSSFTISFDQVLVQTCAANSEKIPFSPQVIENIERNETVHEKTERMAPELLAALENDYLSDWENVIKNNSIREISEFGKKMHTLGKTHNFQQLTNYGQKILIAAQEFDIQELNHLLQEMPKLIQSWQHK